MYHIIIQQKSGENKLSMKSIKKFFDRVFCFRPQKRWLVERYSNFKLWQLKRKKGFAPVKLEIGSGTTFQKGWIPSDYNNLNIVNSNEWDKYFVSGQIEAILAEHVFEHLTSEEAAKAAQNCFFYLKPKGYLRVAVPDGGHPNPDIISMIQPGGSGGGAYDHKVLYTYKTFSKLFEDVGFDIKLYEYYDENANFINNAWDEKEGFISRSFKNTTNKEDIKLKNYSILLDAVKP
jgi:predicted SAM-dependent methyltransferase